MQRKGRISYTVISWLVVGVPACASTSRSSFAGLVAPTLAAADRAAVLGTEQLDRKRLVYAVLQRNPSLESARQAYQAALAHYRQAGALEEPMLAASFAPLSIASSRARFGYQVELSQRIPLGGKLAARAAIAAAEAQVVSSDYADIRLTLALMASELYDDYAVAVRSLEVQTQHIALVQSLKDIATATYASGRASTQDSLQAEAELARLEYQHTQYESQRDIAVAQLNALLHREPGAPLAMPAALATSARDAAKSDPGHEQDIAKRPDIAAAQARVKVAHARVEASEREFYPDLSVSTSYNSMWDMPEHRWMAGVAINIPWQQGLRRDAVAEASAMRAAAESSMASASDAARGQVAVAERQLQQAQRAVRLYEQRVVPIARERIEAARAGFVTSQTSFPSVIDAERGLRAAELELETARGELGKRRAALERALGRVPGLENIEASP